MKYKCKEVRRVSQICKNLKFWGCSSLNFTWNRFCIITSKQSGIFRITDKSWLRIVKKKGILGDFKSCVDYLFIFLFRLCIIHWVFCFVRQILACDYVHMYDLTSTHRKNAEGFYFMISTVVESELFLSISSIEFQNFAPDNLKDLSLDLTDSTLLRIFIIILIRSI